MFRAPDNRSQGIRLLTYAGAGTLAAAVAGATLGAIGSLIPGELRAVLAVVVSLAAIGIGIVELGGRRVPIPQFDRETPYEWLAPGSLLWAVRNGAALGFGARTRLGFWLWYVIPIAAFLGADPLLGALGYGLYGLVRTFGVAGLLRLERAGWFTDIEVLRSATKARMVTNVQLVAIATFVMALIGV